VCFSNPAFITAVHTAAKADSTATTQATQDTAIFTVDKSKAGQAIPAEEHTTKEHLTTQEKAWQFGNGLLDSYLHNRKAGGRHGSGTPISNLALFKTTIRYIPLKQYCHGEKLRIMAHCCFCRVAMHTR